AEAFEVREGMVHANAIKVSHLSLGRSPNVDLNSVVSAVWKIWKEDPCAAWRKTQCPGARQYERFESVRLVKAVNVCAGVLGNRVKNVEVFRAFVDLRVLRPAIVEDQRVMRVFLYEPPAKCAEKVGTIGRAMRDPVAGCRGGKHASAIEADVEAVIF